MGNWLFYSILAFLLWGLWGFFPKIASMYVSPKTILIYQTLGCLIVVLLVTFKQGFNLDFNLKGILFSILAGMAGTLGSLFFLYAINHGKLSVVITITALYPVVTILLALLLLGETLSFRQTVGIILAVVSMVLVAGS